MITQVKYNDHDNTNVKITLEDGREMHAGITGSTWLHTELNEWLIYNTPEPFETEAEKAQRIQNEINAEARTYLSQTDWYVIRLQETGEPIPEDILQKRADARASVVEV